MINKVLVICIGNICRSPMAVALLRHHAPHLQVESAGPEGPVLAKTWPA